MIEINPGFEQVVFRKYPITKEYHDYRKNWTELPKKSIVSEFPMHIDIEICAACNLKCDFCYRPHMEKHFSGTLPFKHIKKVFEQGVPKAVKFNWLNEPTIDKRLPKIVKYCKDQGVLEVMTNTNGTMLDEEMSQKLIDAGMDKLIFSIESIVPEKYSKYRPGGNLDTVIENIKKLIELRGNAQKPYIRVQKINFPKLAEENYKEFWRDIGVDSVGLLTYREADPKKKFNPNVEPCAQLWQRLLITWDGKILPCCRDCEQRCVLGNIKTDSIKDIWHSATLNAIRKMHQFGRANELYLCKNCEVTRV